jgi:hypothetical protein
MADTAGSISALLLAIGQALLGAWLLRRVQRAKKTGIARFPLDFRTGFVYAEQPIHFKAAVIRNTIIGVGFCAMAGAIVVVAILSLLV